MGFGRALASPPRAAHFGGQGVLSFSQGRLICCIDSDGCGRLKDYRRREIAMIKGCAAVIAAFVLTAPAAADSAPPPLGEPRYSFHKVPDGFLRLDRETGEVALCGMQPVGWACLAAPEDRTALEDEIARLHRENAALKQDLLSRGLPLPPGTTAEPPAHDNGKYLTLRLPDRADIDRMVALAGSVWHRLISAIANVSDQVLHKG
jgi:hypothetical protein